MSPEKSSAVIGSLADHKIEKLERENRDLKSYVTTVMQQLRENESLFAKLFDLETQVLSSVDAESLCFTLLRGLRSKFELDMVRLWFDRSSFMGQCRLSGVSERELVWIEKDEFACMGLSEKKVWLLHLNKVSDFPWLDLQDGHLSSMALLLLGDVNGPFGVLGMGSVDAARFHPKQSTDFLQHLAQVVALSLENAFARDRLAMLSVTDCLTGRHNRRFFQPHSHQRLSQWFGQNVCVACIYADVDDFKSVNDQLGHAAGDELLMMVTEKMQQCIRSQDMLIRMGGDEFAIFLPACSLGKAKEIACRMVDACAQLEVSVISIGISVGVAFSDMTEDKMVKDLVKAADQAMYVAKALGGSRVELGV